MAAWTPDTTFYPTSKMTMATPAEWLAYVALLNPHGAGRPDALAVLDVAPTSASSRPGTESSC
jgi:hypothetical protein